ncbi:MAG: DUF177 domain-containing protein [Flavobacteriales bacterium]|nr:MAG: DUF177 domain-containing protein [Flavobacteriales bacterium]
MKNKEYIIPFSGLKIGKHKFDYIIENEFFESFGYDEFRECHIMVDVVLNKTVTMLELEFSAKGTVNVDCDVTNEPFDLPIATTMDLVVKFGETFNDEDDELLIIPHGDHQINIAQYLYEMLVLAVPQKRIHPGVLDGTLKSEALDKLKALQPKEIQEHKTENDPRRDALKKFKTDK